MKTKKMNIRPKLFPTALALFCLLFVSAAGIGQTTNDLGLAGFVPANAESVVVVKNLDDALRPFFKSDFYRRAKKLSLFSGPMKTDVSVPLLSMIGAIRDGLGPLAKPERALWLLGDEAVFYTGIVNGDEAAVGVCTVSGMRGGLIELALKLVGNAAKTEVSGITPYVVTTETVTIYIQRVGDYLIVSDSPWALRNQWEALSGTGGETLAGDAALTETIAGLPDGWDILYITTLSSAVSGRDDMTARLARLASPCEHITAAVEITKTGLTVTVRGPYKAERMFPGIKTIVPAAPGGMDYSLFPADTTALCVVNNLSPIEIYDHFYLNWFSDVGERANFIAVLKKWEAEAGFSVRNGIIAKLASPSYLAFTGIGYQGREPYPDVVVSCARADVSGDGEDLLAEQLNALFSYSTGRGMPLVSRYGTSTVHVVGDFTEEEIEWTGNTYLRYHPASPGFAFRDDRVSFFRDTGAIFSTEDMAVLSSLGDEGAFSGEFLAHRPAFSAATADLPPEAYDVYLYIDGENAAVDIETYLINLSEHYRYFLYRDAMETTVPLLELVKEGCEAFYGGIVLEGDGVRGEFRLTVSDI
ncbi:MAG: hypothetical protein JW885_11295 [Deltaproteobacteria bacterium]|nr:hypothetical protein [Candidatus Zymogenaceae bacterium]